MGQRQRTRAMEEPHDVWIAEPERGIEPLTYSLRVNCSAD